MNNIHLKKFKYLTDDEIGTAMANLKKNYPRKKSTPSRKPTEEETKELRHTIEQLSYRIALEL